MEVSALENIDDCVGKAFGVQIEEIVGKRENEFSAENKQGGQTTGKNLLETSRKEKKENNQGCSC